MPHGVVYLTKPDKNKHNLTYPDLTYNLQPTNLQPNLQTYNITYNAPKISAGGKNRTIAGSARIEP